MTTDEVARRLYAAREVLERYHVASLAVFGSPARGEARMDSDVDLLVEFSTPVGLLTFVRLKRHLEQILDDDVDPVTVEALRDTMKAQILREAVDVTP